MDKPILIPINSLLGAMVVVGNDLNVDEIKEKVTEALVKVYESAERTGYKDKTVLIRINSIMGALVVVGNDLNVDEIKEKVTEALVKAYESAQWLIERKNNHCEPTQDKHQQPQSAPESQNSDCVRSPEDTTRGI